MKVTVPWTAKLLIALVTVAVSLAELPRAIGVGETLVVIDEVVQVTTEPMA